MPNRVIKESWRRSETIDRLSEGAENFCTRLITVADDFGRFLAHPTILIADTYPLRMRRITEAEIESRLQELVSAGMVRLYYVDGKRFGEFVTFQHHNGRRAKHSKFPACVDVQGCVGTNVDVDGSAGTRMDVRANVPEKREARHEKRDTRNETRDSHIAPSAKGPPRRIPERGRARDPDFAAGYTGAFLAFWDAYPKPVAKGRAWRAWQTQEPDLDAVLDALEWQRASPRWQAEGGRFIPDPATYLADRSWQDHPSGYQHGERRKPQTGADDGIREYLTRARDGDRGHPASDSLGLPGGELERDTG